MNSVSNNHESAQSFEWNKLRVDGSEIHKQLLEVVSLLHSQYRLQDPNTAIPREDEFLIEGD
jgi:hypothetical protein